MGTWPEYLTNSIGLKICLGVCLLLVINIVIAKMIERKRIEGGTSEEDPKIQSIKTMKRLWSGTGQTSLNWLPRLPLRERP